MLIGIECNSNITFYQPDYNLTILIKVKTGIKTKSKIQLGRILTTKPSTILV